jgi:hypothetical protein
MLSAQLAEMLLDRDEVAAARPVAEECLRPLDRLPHMQVSGLLSRLALARVRPADRDPDGAMAVLEEARATAVPATGVERVLAAAEASVRMALGDAEAAVRWASSVGPLELPPPLGLQTHLFASAVEAYGVGPARVLLTHGLARETRRRCTRRRSGCGICGTWLRPSTSAPRRPRPTSSVRWPPTRSATGTRPWWR